MHSFNPETKTHEILKTKKETDEANYNCDKWREPLIFTVWFIFMCGELHTRLICTQAFQTLANVCYVIKRRRSLLDILNGVTTINRYTHPTSGKKALLAENLSQAKRCYECDAHYEDIRRLIFTFTYFFSLLAHKRRLFIQWTNVLCKWFTFHREKKWTFLDVEINTAVFYFRDDMSSNYELCSKSWT